MECDMIFIRMTVYLILTIAVLHQFFSPAFAQVRGPSTYPSQKPSELRNPASSTGYPMWSHQECEYNLKWAFGPFFRLMSEYFTKILEEIR